MSMTANAWVNSSGGATITFWSSEGWTSAAWSLQGSAGDFPDPDYVSLYNLWSQSGTGTIDGNFLTVYIASCPDGFFKIEVEHGSKVFMLSEGNMTFGAAVIGLNNARLENYEAPRRILTDTVPKALIYFGGDLTPFKGRVRAQLQVDGVLHATVAGNAVDLVSDYIDYGLWAIPSAIFTEFFWHIVPTGRTRYDFVFQEQKRTGSGNVMSLPVEMDLLQIYSPLSTEAYPVKSSNTFEISLTTGLDVNDD